MMICAGTRSRLDFFKLEKFEIDWKTWTINDWSLLGHETDWTFSHKANLELLLSVPFIFIWSYVMPYRVTIQTCQTVFALRLLSLQRLFRDSKVHFFVKLWFLYHKNKDWRWMTQFYTYILITVFFTPPTKEIFTEKLLLTFNFGKLSKITSQKAQKLWKKSRWHDG